MIEVWKDIEDYKGLYLIDIDGNIKSVPVNGFGTGKGFHRSGRLIKPYYKTVNNYTKVRVCLFKNGNPRKFFLSHLVAKAFPEICGEWFEGCEVHHKDKNPLNNNAYNLIVLSKEEHIEIHRFDERPNPFMGKHHTEETKELFRKIHSKPIYQLDMEGNIVNSWDSVTECERQTGIHKAAISRCCLGKQKTAGGYRWKYKQVA